MKHYYLVISLILAVSVTSLTANAQEKSPQQIENSIKKNGKYAFLVQNSRHFIAAVETGERFRAKSEKIRFVVILVGPVVKDLATNKELQPYVDRAEKAGEKIVVCENSMKHLGIKKSAYAPSILTTPHGFTYILGLQENGFKTVQL